MIPIQESRSTHPHTYNHFELNFPLPLSHLDADILAGLLSPQSTTPMINFNLLTSSMTSDGGEGCSLLSFHAHTHTHTRTLAHIDEQSSNQFGFRMFSSSLFGIRRIFFVISLCVQAVYWPYQFGHLFDGVRSDLYCYHSRSRLLGKSIKVLINPRFFL